MTRKDYELIAAMIKKLYRYRPDSERALAICTFADEFKLHNPRFDYDRFSAACKDELYQEPKPKTLQEEWIEGDTASSNFYTRTF